jgi:hypothetical protein
VTFELFLRPRGSEQSPTHLADAAMDPMLNDAELSPTPRVGRSTIDRSSNPSPHRPNLDSRLLLSRKNLSLAHFFAPARRDSYGSRSHEFE